MRRAPKKRSSDDADLDNPVSEKNTNSNAIIPQKEQDSKTFSNRRVVILSENVKLNSFTSINYFFFVHRIRGLQQFRDFKYFLKSCDYAFVYRVISKEFKGKHPFGGQLEYRGYFYFKTPLNIEQTKVLNGAPLFCIMLTENEAIDRIMGYKDVSNLSTFGTSPFDVAFDLND